MAGLPVKSDTLAPLTDLIESRLPKLAEAQSQHWQQATELGLPNNKHEDWKYTSLESFKQIDFSSQSAANVTEQDIVAKRLDIDAHLLVFIDGQFTPALSDYATAQVTPIADYQGELPAAISPEIFLHLTEAFNQSGVVIEVDRKNATEKPWYILNVETLTQGGMAQTRNHLKLGTSSHACVIEHFVTLNETAPALNHYVGSRLTIDVADNSQLAHYKICQGSVNSHHFAHNDIHIGRDAEVDSQTFMLSGQVIRHHTSAALNGENSELNMNSLSLPVSDQTYDTRTYLEHNKGHCTSEQLHKIIGQGQSKSVFNGMIKVAQHALKTDGQMENHNLLLSEHCEINSKPQLEIYADDVKCSHGTTTGALSKEQIFYLQARGIGQEQAEQMITLAFAGEVTEEIEIDQIKQVVFAQVVDKLSGAGQ
ncbi:Fe-S cluster assembly protein SufD [Vibrio sp. LaRot3]|uniref:Fe-S cluster assembly protein SufD n=1 Tax=Vibrio sp. LaRot3 TaxID=2998829 RepID=UPI0022CE164F|nr:Fe-S cluster assembly protein SufD [Vibrio sp. LaRot3]MDA0149157.1 Fe-S cluster assembly protein SufD [Vibrio sp. LaRot3]